MASKIGTQTGIEASRLELLSMAGKLAVAAVGFDKLLGQPGKDYGFGAVEGTLQQLVNGHNEYQDRITALEQKVASLT